MFANALESMAKAEFEKIKARLMTIDADHDGIPDVVEAEKLVSEGVAELEALEAKVTPEEAATALNVLFPGKFTSEEVVAGEAAIAKVISAIQHVAGIAKAAEVAL